MAPLPDQGLHQDHGDGRGDEEQHHHRHGHDDHQEGGGRLLGGDGQHLKIPAGRHEGHKLLVLSLAVSAGHLKVKIVSISCEENGIGWITDAKHFYLIEIFDSTFIESIHCLCYPGAISFTAALPSVIMNCHELHPLAGPATPEVQIETQEEVTVQSEHPELR